MVTPLHSDQWPEYITNRIRINNEVLFSYKMITNNVPVKEIRNEWNYYVDWNSSFKQDIDEFETCKFRHYLNKNFDKQWPI